MSKEVKFCKGPACPYFTCIKKALKIVRKSSKAVVLCALTNDQCIGYKCQYSSCSAHVMDSEGRCLLDLKGVEKEEIDIVSEAKKMEKEVAKIKHHLKKLGLEDYL